LQNDVDRLPQQNRIQDQQIQQNEQVLGQNRSTHARKFLGDVFSSIAQSQDPLGTGRTILSNPSFQAALRDVGMDPAQFTIDQTDTPEGLQRQSMDLARMMGAQLNGAEGFTLGQGQTRFGPNGQPLASVAPAPREFQPRQAEPPVSVMGPNGAPVYVSREDALGQTPYEKPSGGLSARDATTARNKLTMIRLARQQIAEARQAFQPLKGSFSAGPLGQYVPTQDGQAFDAKINTMRGTITGLKRVPGVGAMSDYETRLDQSMMPERGRYEATTEQQLNDLDTMLNYMEQGYGGMLEDAGAQPSTQAPAAGGGWTITEIK
jgi:hypothetical protein